MSAALPQMQASVCCHEWCAVGGGLCQVQGSPSSFSGEKTVMEPLLRFLQISEGRLGGNMPQSSAEQRCIDACKGTQGTSVPRCDAESEAAGACRDLEHITMNCNRATGCLADYIFPVLTFHKNLPVLSTSHHGNLFSMIQQRETTNNKHNIQYYINRHVNYLELISNLACNPVRPLITTLEGSLPPKPPPKSPHMFLYSLTLLSSSRTSVHLLTCFLRSTITAKSSWAQIAWIFYRGKWKTYFF